jgi:hypothetical protein
LCECHTFLENATFVDTKYYLDKFTKNYEAGLYEYALDSGKTVRGWHEITGDDGVFASAKQKDLFYQRLAFVETFKEEGEAE